MVDYLLVEQLADAFFDRMDDPAWRHRAFGHSHAVAVLAALLAKMRGLDGRIAAICGILHDLAAYERCSYEDHARLGAQRAIEILKQLGEQDTEVLEQVHSAISCHDELEKIDGPMDEVLKDADLLANAQLKDQEMLRPAEASRMQRLMLELGNSLK